MRFPSKSRVKIPGAVVALALLLLATGCPPQKAAETGSKDVPVPPLPVEALVVELTSVAPAAQALGTLYPWRVVMIQAETGGRVIAVHAEAGDARKAGELLLEIDATRIEASRRLAQAGVRQARVAQKRARRERERFRRLAEQQAVARQRLDELQDAVEQANAAVESARAQVALVERQLLDTKVMAPFDGVVTDRTVELGALVGPGVPVMTLQEVDRLKATAAFPADALRNVHVGAPVRVAVPAAGLEGLEGTVHRIADTADPRTRRIPIEVLLPRTTDSLRPGLSARITLPTGASEDRILVPRSAIVDRFGAPHAYVVRDGVAVQLPVQLGEGRGERVRVREGLAVGDWLVVAGQERLSAGARVQVVDGDTLADPKKDEALEAALDSALDTAVDPSGAAPSPAPPAADDE